MDQILAEIAKQGPLGLILAWFIWDGMQKSAQLKELAEKRFQDMRDNLDRTHALALTAETSNKTVVAAIEAQSRAIEALRQRP